MQLLKGELVALRAMEPTDLELLYRWENDSDVWTISNTRTPFSKYVLKNFIETSSQDIYTAKQLRLMINEKSTGNTIGIIDLFDFDPFHLRVGVGILIGKEYRQKGYAKESLQLLKEYAFEVLQVQQIFCNIMEDNEVSLSLFAKEGFQVFGNKRKWIRTNDGFKDELILQCFRKQD